VLKAAFKTEGETNLAGWTTLGLYELTRKRDRLPLAELLHELPDLRQARRLRLPPLLLAPLRRRRPWPLADRKLPHPAEGRDEAEGPPRRHRPRPH
jgi:hypothetical protein